MQTDGTSQVGGRKKETRKQNEGKGHKEVPRRQRVRFVGKRQDAQRSPRDREAHVINGALYGQESLESLGKVWAWEGV